jgi:hypothetical protein
LDKNWTKILDSTKIGVSLQANRQSTIAEEAESEVSEARPEVTVAVAPLAAAAGNVEHTPKVRCCRGQPFNFNLIVNKL